ncbi:MAG: hypothetical protein KME17_16055 [Cyanosarcina radialis HA8281-LM2]|jgi:hypothetical protein|nr:hypothetical protein [Cyanosarcina radialis HA8281-LM2]
MNTRAEAVKYLQSFGFYAIERTWVMGDTIFVAAEPIEMPGISLSFRKAVYIYPRNGLWSVDDIKGPRPSDPRCVPLQEACDIAMETLQNLI